MKPLHSYAIDHAIMVIGHSFPQRSAGGYGTYPRHFVALKTARRVIDLGFAIAEPKFGAKSSRLALTPVGKEEFTKLQEREGRQP